MTKQTSIERTINCVPFSYFFLLFREYFDKKNLGGDFFEGEGGGLIKIYLLRGGGLFRAKGFFEGGG